MNLTLPSYFRLVNFYNKTPKEQIKYILFFVTVVAELRKNMTPKIITHRLNDQGQQISEEEVKSIIENDTYNFKLSEHIDLRDRKKGEKAYEIAPNEKKRMIKEVNLAFARINSWKKPMNIIFILLSILCLIILLTIIGYHVTTSKEIADLSWNQYKSRIRFNEISSTEKAKYLLYFVTEHIKFRQDMTPFVISNRLFDLGYGKISPQEIEKYFRLNNDKIIPSGRKNAYKISLTEKKRILGELDLKIPKGEGTISVNWMLKH
ncbi:MAG: hypothetical protein GXO74_03400, partial [Calditrichaeota bacterium]|nr:hypothetical protein [Calditrichota bacterium]